MTDQHFLERLFYRTGVQFDCADKANRLMETCLFHIASLVFVDYLSFLYSEIACIVFATGRAKPSTPMAFPMIISPVIREDRYRSPAVKTVCNLALVHGTVVSLLHLFGVGVQSGFLCFSC